MSKKTVTTLDIAELVTQNYNLPTKLVKQVMNKVFEEIATQVLHENKRVMLYGFGVFDQRNNSSRILTDHITKKKFATTESVSLSFKTSKALIVKKDK